MTQSRRMSLVEAVTNVAVGYALAVVTQIVVFPWFGVQASLGGNLALGGGLHRNIAPAQLRAAQTVRSRAKAIVCVSCAGLSAHWSSTFEWLLRGNSQ